jgi:DNA-directed RNA polymerase subunit M/transcription elongation factor TFIIS
MGTGYTYKCDRCGYAVSTSGPWEFYRDSKGNRKPYGHPVPTSQEAKERGIYGFSGDLYCPKCDKIFDVVLVEFTGPLRDYFAAWAGWREPRDEFKEEGGVKCPECHVTNMIWDTSEAEKVVCPRCKEGILHGEVIWIA